MNAQAQVLSWADFGRGVNRNVEVSPTTFNNPLGNYFTVGKHSDVKVVSVTPKMSKAGPMLAFVFENDAGASIKKNLFLTGRDKSGKENVNYLYQQLIGSLSPSDPALAFEFHTTTVQNPEALAGLVGLRTSIQTELDNEGYAIVQLGEDNFQIQDRKTQSKWEGTDEIYESIMAAKDAAKELGIYRAKVEVKKFFRCSKAYEVSNEKALRAVISNSTTPSAAGNKTAASSVRRSSI
jgi:hypothetical protein